MRYILFIAFIILITSCNQRESGSETVTTQKEEVDIDSLHIQLPGTQADSTQADSTLLATGCYMKVSGRDTVLMQLDQSGTAVIGRIVFDNYQIDGSSGTLKGTVDKNIITVWYDFESEGSHSVRQLVFKMDGSRLLRGSGEEKTVKDTSRMADPSSATFNETDILVKTDCKDLLPLF